MSSTTPHPQRMPNRVSGNESVIGRLGEGTEHYIEDHPTSTALMTFLTGMGAGFLLTTMLVAEQKKRSRKNVAERLGDQVLEYLHDVVPRSVSDRFSR